MFYSNSSSIVRMYSNKLEMYSKYGQSTSQIGYKSNLDIE